jgi:hypothetical protein
MVEAGSLSENIPGTSIDAATATAGQLRQAIASGALTSADLTAFYLARIERLNPGLRAVITVSECRGRRPRQRQRQGRRLAVEAWTLWLGGRCHWSFLTDGCCDLRRLDRSSVMSGRG